jgi:putative DNA primase/helicase
LMLAEHVTAKDLDWDHMSPEEKAAVIGLVEISKPKNNGNNDFNSDPAKNIKVGSPPIDDAPFGEKAEGGKPIFKPIGNLFTKYKPLKDGGPPYGPGIRLISAANIKPEPIRWIWDGYLAMGKLHLIAGKPSAGKTAVALDLSATISCGGTFPDGARAQPGNVLIWSGEDGLADTLVPRLIVAGADMSRIKFVGEKIDGSESRAFYPAVDMPLLERAAEQLGDVTLLILDPVVSTIQGDSHKNAEVRRGLQPVVDFCQRVGCAVIGITHLSKGTQGQDPIDRITGSLAFGAVARVILLATREENSGDELGPGRRVITRVKNNIGADGGGFFYEIREKYPGLSAARSSG